MVKYQLIIPSRRQLEEVRASLPRPDLSRPPPPVPEDPEDVRDLYSPDDDQLSHPTPAEAYGPSSLDEMIRRV